MKVLAHFCITPRQLAAYAPGVIGDLINNDEICRFDKKAPPVIKFSLPVLPEKCCGVRIELQLLNDCTAEGQSDVWSFELFQGSASIKSAPVVSYFTRSGKFRMLTLDACTLIDRGEAAEAVICRRIEDPADTFSGASMLAGVIITALAPPEESFSVENAPGYNSWPMCQTLGDTIVCTYCRGSEHNIFEPHRAVYARVSRDGGSSWEEETLVCNTPDRGDVTVGKGLDENSNMLLLVRHSGKDGFRHRLYRTGDGKSFDLVCDMALPLDTIQITDIFYVPQVGLTAFCFGGSYGSAANKYWGKLVSKDNGSSWEFTVIEKNLTTADWPTEPSAVYLGNGRIIIIARTESGEDSTQRSQFQLTSTDYGQTWHKNRTNITDVKISTPSLLYDCDSDQLCCYYFYRGRGILNRRTADAQYIFDHPMEWAAPETVAIGSCEVCEAGNVNATCLGSRHIIAYYSGTMPNTAIYVKICIG